jgi:hypothetical protein
VASLKNYIKTITRDNYIEHFDRFTVPQENNRMRGRHWNHNINIVLNTLWQVDRQVCQLQELNDPT